MIGCGLDSLSSFGSINKERSELTDDAGVGLSSAVSSEVQSIIESGVSELIRDVTDGLRFS